MTEKEKFGFGSMNLQETEWDVYKGAPVCVHYNQNTAYGVVKKIDVARNFVYLQPSIRMNLQGTKFIFESEIPTMIPAQGCVVRPLKDGELESFVKESNEQKEKEEKTEKKENKQNGKKI